MTDFQKFTGNCAGNVSKDAKYAIRRGEGGEPVVSLTYSTEDDEKWYMSTESHEQLVEMVNDVKKGKCGSPNGSFYINEYKQVIVPVAGTKDYFYAGEYREPLRFEFEGKTISAEPIDSAGQILSPGDDWTLPVPGIPYVLAAGGQDIYYTSNPRPNVEKKVKLSKDQDPQVAKEVASAISKFKGHAGGRFYVNEFAAIFFPVSNDAEVRRVYAGQIDFDKWFNRPTFSTTSDLEANQTAQIPVDDKSAASIEPKNAEAEDGPKINDGADKPSESKRRRKAFPKRF